MSSVTGMKAKAKRSKQKRLKKKSKEIRSHTCKFCYYGMISKNGDCAFCKVANDVVKVKTKCRDFKKE